MRTFSVVVLTSLFAAVTPSIATADDATSATTTGAKDRDLQQGFVDAQPASGRFVKVGNRYMVPYTATIPGTEVTYTMVPIPGGTFKIGSPDSEADRSDDEGPQRTIQVEPFWMGQYEVTWAEYQEYMKLYEPFKELAASGIRVVTPENQIDAITAPTPLHEPHVTYEKGQDPRHPAVSMTQFAAKQYTHWLSGLTGRQYRLPSEAEWEYACRAGTTTAYYFGDDASQLGEYAWFYDNSDSRLHFVGKKKPNPWGLYDMHGSVWEWTLDLYHENGYARLEDKPHTAASAVAWPDEEYPRVLRGGSWDDEADRCRAAAKLASDDEEWKASDPQVPLSPWWLADEPAFAVGFRMLRPLKTLPKKEMARYWKADVPDISDAVEIKLDGGKGSQGLVDKDLPAAIKKLKADK